MFRKSADEAGLNCKQENEFPAKTEVPVDLSVGDRRKKPESQTTKPEESEEPRMEERNPWLKSAGANIQNSRE